MDDPMKNISRTPSGKTRRLDKPYAIYTNAKGWEWRGRDAAAA